MQSDEKGEREMEHLYEKALESAECPRAGNRQSGGRYHVPLAGRGDSENGVNNNQATGEKIEFQREEMFLCSPMN